MHKTTVWASFFLLIFLGLPNLAGAQIFSSQEQSLSPQPGLDEQKVWDPLERSNRKVFYFNDLLYTDVVQPVTVVYKKLPSPVQKVVRNGFQNLEGPSRFVNLVLQGKPGKAGEEMTRFVINSTVGVGGMFDVAHNAFGIQDHDADFGQTLGTWYVEPGPYLVVPALGPSNARDLVGFAADHFMDPLYWVPGPFWVTWPADFVKYTSKASDHIDQYETLKKGSLDPYVAMRNAYMQHRQNEIPGRPPQLADGAAGGASAIDNARRLEADQNAAAIAPRAKKKLWAQKPRKNAPPRELAEALREAASNESDTPFEAVLQEYPQLAGAVAARGAIAQSEAFRPDWGQDNQERLSIATELICRAVARGDRFTRGQNDSRLEQFRETACDRQRKIVNSDLERKSM
ncbi:MAG: VacJ family lipoprotein [Syntrophobacteraceae bacterium]|nr:VacJ family lipoprotein [Syntrophobacteraceae bacterium]